MVIKFFKGLFLGRKAASAAKAPNFLHIVTTPTGVVTFVDPSAACEYARGRGNCVIRTVRVASF